MIRTTNFLPLTESSTKPSRYIPYARYNASTLRERVDRFRQHYPHADELQDLLQSHGMSAHYMSSHDCGKRAFFENEAVRTLTQPLSLIYGKTITAKHLFGFDWVIAIRDDSEKENCPTIAACACLEYDRILGRFEIRFEGAVDRENDDHHRMLHMAIDMLVHFLLAEWLNPRPSAVELVAFVDRPDAKKDLDIMTKIAGFQLRRKLEREYMLSKIISNCNQ